MGLIHSQDILESDKAQPTTAEMGSVELRRVDGLPEARDNHVMPTSGETTTGRDQGIYMNCDKPPISTICYDNAAFEPSVKMNGTMNGHIDSDTDLSEVSVETPTPTQTDDNSSCGSCSVVKIRNAIHDCFNRHKEIIQLNIKVLLVCLYGVYFGYCLWRKHPVHEEDDIRLIWVTWLAVVMILYSKIKHRFNDPVGQHIINPMSKFINRHWKIFKWGFIILAVSLYLGFIILTIIKHWENLMSLVGYVVFIFIIYLFSTDPSKVKWQPVLWGLGIQFAMALIIIKSDWGLEASKWLGDRASELLSHTKAGAKFIFEPNEEDHFFAFQVLPIVIFFSSLVSILYHVGAMQAVIGSIASVMQATLGTTAAESTNAAGNIFIGQTESPLLIKPFLEHMTKSEIHAVMTGGFATIAGSVLAAYIMFGVPANHLITASFLAAPCALGLSKLSCPESQSSQLSNMSIKDIENTKATNVLEAAGNGASAAISLVANIAANLLAFLSLLQFVNMTLKWFGDRADMEQDLSFQLICSYAFWPFAFLMGVPQQDCGKVAELIGTKMFLNEFVAFDMLGVSIKNSDIFNDCITSGGNYTDMPNGDIFLEYTNSTNTTLVGGILEDRSQVISTYALCGFANVGSMGMTLGALSAMAPNQRSTIASISVRAMLTGTAVSFLSACTAGLLYDN